MCSFQLHQQLDSDIALVIYMWSSLVLAGNTLGITPPLPVTPYHEYNIVLAVQMVNVLSRSRQRTQIGAVQCGSLDQVA